MVNRAITEGWDVPVAQRPSIITELIAIATTAESDRDKIGAAKTLLSATKLQLDEAKLDLDRQRLDVDRSAADNTIRIVYEDRNARGEAVAAAPEPEEDQG